MNIIILGYGRMGHWFAKQLSKNHTVAVYEKDTSLLNGTEDIIPLHTPDQMGVFQPGLVINAVNLDLTQAAFENILPFLPGNTIFSDITSIKSGIETFYTAKKVRYVSTHPMFGPTFGDLNNLKNENAIIIEESDEEGKDFFEEFYSSLGLNLHFIPFSEHDKLMAQSLSLPFLSSLLFSANAVPKITSGTTYQKHLNLAKGLLSEDDSLLSEVLLNKHTLTQIEHFRENLNMLSEIINENNSNKMVSFLGELASRIHKS